MRQALEVLGYYIKQLKEEETLSGTSIKKGEVVNLQEVQAIMNAIIVFLRKGTNYTGFKCTLELWHSDTTTDGDFERVDKKWVSANAALNDEGGIDLADIAKDNDGRGFMLTYNGPKQYIQIRFVKSKSNTGAEEAISYGSGIKLLQEHIAYGFGTSQELVAAAG